MEQVCAADFTTEEILNRCLFVFFVSPRRAVISSKDINSVHYQPYKNKWCFI